MVSELNVLLEHQVWKLRLPLIGHVVVISATSKPVVCLKPPQRAEVYLSILLAPGGLQGFTEGRDKT